MGLGGFAVVFLLAGCASQGPATSRAGRSACSVRSRRSGPDEYGASLAGTAASYGFVAEIGSVAATGRPVGSTPNLGQTGMEVQFRDGASGRIVAECDDTEIGLKYAADMNAGAAGAAETWINGYIDSFSQWTYAKNAFDKWAADFARRFGQLRSGRS